MGMRLTQWPAMKASNTARVIGSFLALKVKRKKEITQRDTKEKEVELQTLQYDTAISCQYSQRIWSFLDSN